MATGRRSAKFGAYSASANNRPTVPTRPSRRSSRIASSIPNRSDFEASLSKVPDDARAIARQRTLQAVVIPKMQSIDLMRYSSSLTSLRTSSASSSSGEPVGHETPDTSAVNTPGWDSSLQMGPINNKRKRSSAPSPCVVNDTDLVMLLQDEECAGPSHIRSNHSSNSVRVSIDLTAASESEPLSPPISISDSDSDASVVPLTKRPRTFKGKAKAKTLTPSVRTTTSSLQPNSTTHRAIINLDSDEDSALRSQDSEVEYISLSDASETASSSVENSDIEIDMTRTRDSMQSIRAAGARRVAHRATQQAQRGRNVADRIAAWRDNRKAARRKKLERAHPEIKTIWSDLAEVPIIEPQKAPQPESISRKLKSFQLEGLDWMMKQEKSTYKGGLLGDEMGMGKTIQAVSLIMSDHPAKDPTLVLVPPVALMQWSNEIREYTNGKLNVLICHTSNKEAKNLTTKTIRSYDVIVMSYNTLESMYRKQEKGWTRGEDIVKEDSPIHAVTFHRLILDEAHSIKQRTTGVAKACFALKGKYKWCLSGTPVQNRIGEFFSLLRFLEIRPFADYFCERCSCAQLHWSITEEYKCTHCNHASSEHRSIFNEELLNPITGLSMTERQEALKKLHMVTARVMLRRMKKDHTSSMELPPKEIVIHNEFFGEIERDFSSSVMTNTTRKFDTYVAQGVMLNNYANIFGLIMQMRQVANHPDLILKKHAEGGQNVLVCNICDEPAEEAIRSKCHHEFCRSCARSYVQSCEGAGGEADCPRCHIPLAIDWEQPDIEQDEEQVKKSSIINRIKMENWTSSTKIEMLVYELFKLRSKKQTLKSIVFSQFTSMLQLIEWRLRRAGFNTVMLDGSMTPIQRQRSIDYFMTNSDVEVFLVSLKAGGVALNLTEASRVFIVDPWWNPAAEWQSADRCHRIGQTRPCVITRLVIEDSVESRMVMLQEKKASMISGTINNDTVAMEKLSPEDLQFLFRGT